MRRIVVLLTGFGLLVACGQPAAQPNPTASSAPTAVATSTISPPMATAPTPSVSSSPAPTPTPAPTAAASGLPDGFVCANASGGSSSAGSAVTAVRVASHVSDGGYDRFVIEFEGTIPGYEVTRQTGTSFTTSPKGDHIALAGTTGILIRLQPVSDWTAYSAPTSFNAQLPYLRAARLIENFEAVQEWALGVEGQGCIRVMTLSSPSRLVVDVAS